MTDYDQQERELAELFSTDALTVYSNAISIARERYPIASSNLVRKRALSTLRTALDMIERGEQLGRRPNNEI